MHQKLEAVLAAESSLFHQCTVVRCKCEAQSVGIVLGLSQTSLRDLCPADRGA